MCVCVFLACRFLFFFFRRIEKIVWKFSNGGGGKDHGWFFLEFVVFMWGFCDFVFWGCFRWVLSICVAQEWGDGLHIRGWGCGVRFPMANLDCRG